MLALDLFIFHRKSHKIEIKEALISSAIWIGIALIFNIGLYYFQGKDAALKFLTGYLIEKSLSIDNLFVFLMIFKYFNTPPQYIHKILFWGILGAIIMRALFILLGITLVSAFHWILYIFGAFLVFTGIKMALHKAEEVHPEKNILLRLFKKLMPVTSNYHGNSFFIKENDLWMATPLFVTLLAVESTDILFAVDSIPAIMAITLDPFIIYSSNIFAILGLRALFFALAGMMDLFHFLHYGLALILVFVGTKMLISDFIKIPIGLALGFIATILFLSVIVSLIYPKH
jgi:tellurite resistance protein TerC